MKIEVLKPIDILGRRLLSPGQVIAERDVIELLMSMGLVRRVGIEAPPDDTPKEMKHDGSRRARRG